MHFIPGFRSQLVTASKSRRQFVLSAREVERMREEKEEEEEHNSR